MFKKRRGIRLSYNRQGLIYFVCINYYDMPKGIQAHIRALCEEVGKEYFDALFDVITSEKKMYQIAMEYFVSESLLYELRKKFYEKFKWPQK